MFQALKQMFARGADPAAPAVPPGQRIYAVGDIHGRRDLFEALVEAIEADDTAAGPAESTVVLLGKRSDDIPWFSALSVGAIVRAAQDAERKRRQSDV